MRSDDDKVTALIERLQARSFVEATSGSTDNALLFAEAATSLRSLRGGLDMAIEALKRGAAGERCSDKDPTP